MNHLRTRILLYIVVSFSLVSLTASSQTERKEELIRLINEKASWNYREFILNKLRSNRIVMLADQGHGEDLYSQTIIEVLNHWVTTCETSTKADLSPDIPQRIYLVLEMDSIAVENIRHYFVTGNLINVVDPESFMGYQFTTGTLEFFSGLRNLRLRIDTLNVGRLKDHPIQFDLLGPEKHIDTDKSNWTAEKRDMYFAFERDEYSSSRIIELLDRQPDAKVLAYYGSAHLILGLQQKPPEKPVGKGYYLAHYLTERFRDKGGVYTCGQVSIPSSPWLDNAFEKIEKSFAMDNSRWNAVTIDANASFSPFDGTIFHSGKVTQSRHISKTLSENLIDLILSKIDLHRTVSNEFNRSYLWLWFMYLSNFTNKDYSLVDTRDSIKVDSVIHELKQWRLTTRIDVVQEIEQLVIWKRLIDRVPKYPEQQSTFFLMNLGNYIGFKVWFQGGASPVARSEATWKSITSYKKSITLENLVALLWVGTGLEKERALIFLRRETGKEFRTAKEWTAWLSQMEL